MLTQVAFGVPLFFFLFALVVFFSLFFPVTPYILCVVELVKIVFFQLTKLINNRGTCS
jgi:hypothetical protein